MIKLENFKKNQNLQLISWWGICFVIQSIILHHLHYSFYFSIIDSFFTNAILLLISLLLKQIQNYFHSNSILTVKNFAVLTVFTLFYIYSYRYLGSYILPTREWIDNSSNSATIIRGIIVFLLLLLIFYQLWINKNNSFQDNKTQEILEIERQLNKAELINIQQQLQPHFLFNSLNSISALTVVQPEEARRMVHLLSDFLRGTLSKNQEQMVNLSEELDYLNLYLEIEKVRFGHRLQIDIRIDSECEKALIPTFILQPIVENSIKYGLYGQIGELTISIKAACENNQLLLSISNPYDKETVNSSKGIGFGLSSIQKKIYLLYGRNDLLQIEKTETQFTTILTIPQK